MMTVASTTTLHSGTSSTSSSSPSSTPTSEYGMILTQNVEGNNNVNIHVDDSDGSDVDDANSSVNESYYRSTSSGEWRMGAGEESTESSRREYEHHLEELASKETRAVIQLKLLVFGSLFVSMLAVVFLAYFFTAQGERNNFEVNFYDDAKKILGNMGHNLQRTMEVSDAFISSITSFAAHTNQTWPFVVIPDYYVTAEKIRSVCGAVYVTTYHVVENDERKEWENFTATMGTEMIDEAIATIAEYNVMDWPITPNYTAWNVIYDWGEYDKENKGEEGVSYDGPYLPMWQIQPTIAEIEGPYNWDLMSLSPIPGQERTAAEIMMQEHKPIMTAPYLLADKSNPEQYQQDLNDASWLSAYLPQLEFEEVLRPIFDFQFPILADAHDKIQWMDGAYSKKDHEVVAILAISIYWSYMIRDILPQGSNGILVVFESECTPKFTYEVNGPDVVYLGAGEFNDPKYDHMTIGSMVSDLRFHSSQPSTYSGPPLEDSYCPIYIAVHPSAKMEAAHTTNKPWIFALVTACVFLLTVLTFMLYNYVVEQRQKIVLKTAVTSNAIVSSLFPEAVKKQLMETQAKEQLSDDTLPKGKLKAFLNDGSKNDNAFDDERGGSVDFVSKNAKQIAELFPDTTVMFADIAGFTAWASSREPSHVFTLLETLYGAFDRQARRMGIFKVETIGDCYVAVCGLPESNKHHALKMAKFAGSCLDEMIILTKRLELSLGPGTTELALRLGLHSGPTIAGVLRGEKARFQLFGDTVNTASRMESSSQPNKIQVSQKTAELVVEAGKGHWLTARKDLVNAKGKGLLQTYWLDPKRSRTTGSNVSSVDELGTDDEGRCSGLNVSRGMEPENNPFSSTDEISAEKLQRLIDWNVELFEDLIKPIVQKRREKHGGRIMTKLPTVNETVVPEGSSVRNQVVAIVRVPEFQPNPAATREVDLDPVVVSQLRLYITTVANLYRSNNAFHNFEHASHVIMSTVKLLQRVGTRDVKKKDINNQKEYYDYTFGISTDALTKFAIVFSALIHDLDHDGVSNWQLIKEQHPIAVTFDGLSPMEQHSFTLAFELLMEDSYNALRAALYDSQEEFNRFLQLCINCVIATDVFDKDLKAFREDRWNKVFAATGSSTLTDEEAWHGKATITIEYIIQASDVAHTMQHWHVYQGWNKRLFMEMYAAYRAGRADKSPLGGWYEGELWFFDNYVIPLARKLRECEVFGVDCDQLLDYATQNRMEWQRKGADIVQSWKEELEGNGNNN